jgi:hypothetical protein
MRKKEGLKMARTGGLIVLLILLVSGCAATAPKPPKTVPDDKALQDAALVPVIEQLYLNFRAADQDYRRLRDLAEGYLFGPDDQLSTYQKVYLHIGQANTICRNQWELLAIVDYIRPEMRSDYFTLRVRDLERAISETGTLLKAVDVYQAFLENRKVQRMVDDCVRRIETHVYLYEKLIAQMGPLKNPDKPTPFGPPPE